MPIPPSGFSAALETERSAKSAFSFKPAGSFLSGQARAPSNGNAGAAPGLGAPSIAARIGVSNAYRSGAPISRDSAPVSASALRGNASGLLQKNCE
jgi:hypothetical protein